jgi:hypothetical protein
MRISLRTFSILLLVASSLWLLAVLAPPVYCWFKPPQDFQAVVWALQNRGWKPPASAASAVQQTIASAGPLQRALQIGYYVRAQVTLQANQQHVRNEAQASYVATFQNLGMPILLIVQKQQIDNGMEDYQIAQGDPTGLVRGFLLPCAVFAGAVLTLRWSKARGRGRIRTTSGAR